MPSVKWIYAATTATVAIVLKIKGNSTRNMTFGEIPGKRIIAFPSEICKQLVSVNEMNMSRVKSKIHPEELN